jgi:hypothetical protein
MMRSGRGQSVTQHASDRQQAPYEFSCCPLMQVHTSYLRLNYYPPNPDPGNTLGISPHRDAGFLTVLWQDPNCHSLQVQRPAPPGSSLRRGAPLPPKCEHVANCSYQVSHSLRSAQVRGRSGRVDHCHTGRGWFDHQHGRHGADLVEQSVPCATAPRADECDTPSVFGAFLLQPRLPHAGCAAALAWQAGLLAMQVALFITRRSIHPLRSHLTMSCETESRSTSSPTLSLRVPDQLGLLPRPTIRGRFCGFWCRNSDRSFL